MFSALLRRSQAFQFWQFFLGRAAPERGPIVLTQRRVYILPTRHGYTFALALVLMLIGSINYQLSLGYVLTFLLAGMGLVSILHTFRNLAQLSVTAGRSEPVFAGELAHFQLHLENRNEFDRVALVLSLGKARVECEVPGLRTTGVTLGLPALRRGWLPLPRATIETRYPIGLLRAWGYVQPDMRTLVYPRPDDAPLPPTVMMPDNGDSASVGAGTDDFSGLRPYQPADSPRHIAWKTAAREHSTLMTKVFAGRGTAELWLDWLGMPESLGVEARLSRLARWVLLADAQGLAYGLRLPGEEITPGTGAAHRDDCLKRLALFDARPAAVRSADRP